MNDTKPQDPIVAARLRLLDRPEWQYTEWTKADVARFNEAARQEAKKVITYSRDSERATRPLRT